MMTRLKAVWSVLRGRPTMYRVTFEGSKIVVDKDTAPKGIGLYDNHFGVDYGWHDNVAHGHAKKNTELRDDQ